MESGTLLKKYAIKGIGETIIRTIPPETRIIFNQVLWHSVKNLKASSLQLILLQVGPGKKG